MRHPHPFGRPGRAAGGNLHPQWTGELYDYPAGWLRDGDLPKAGGRELRAVATPGHTRGHLCFADEDAGLFAGDHVLPDITLALGFAVIDGQRPAADDPALAAPGPAAARR